jgi:hypothetical protein
MMIMIQNAEVEVPALPQMAYVLGIVGAVFCMVHTFSHLCQCGHLAHDDSGVVLDRVWIASWGGMMILVAAKRRRRNWLIYFWVLVTGGLSFGLGALTLLPLAMLIWSLFNLTAVKQSASRAI